MAKISTDLRSGTLHPRENVFTTATLGALNAETVTFADGSSTVAIDLRGTFNMTIEVSGTVDGANWTLIPMRPINQAAVAYVAAIAGTAAGVWVGPCAGFRQVRARVTAYTSGAATAVLSASSAVIDQSLALTAPGFGTTVGTVGAATTLTLAAPGAGLRHYVTFVNIVRFVQTALTASGTPIAVTTTNMPGAMAFTFPADGAALGTVDRWREDFAYPIAAAAQNTATTVVCPATPNVIWRISAGFYVAP